jgi:hypothetical protein
LASFGRLPSATANKQKKKDNRRDNSEHSQSPRRDLVFVSRIGCSVKRFPLVYHLFINIGRNVILIPHSMRIAALWRPNEITLIPGIQGELGMARWTAPADGEHKVAVE